MVREISTANTKNTFETGRKGEDLVCGWYLERGYILVCKNYEYRHKHHQGRLGEIDLIFEKENKVFLVEVKTRQNEKFGKPQESLTKNKLKLLYKTYQFFILDKKYQKYRNYFCQFDLATVDSFLRVQIIPNAYNFDFIYAQ